MRPGSAACGCPALCFARRLFTQRRQWRQLSLSTRLAPRIPCHLTSDDAVMSMTGRKFVEKPFSSQGRMSRGSRGRLHLALLAAACGLGIAFSPAMPILRAYGPSCGTGLRLAFPQVVPPPNPLPERPTCATCGRLARN